MAQTVDLWGATYSNVPYIKVPSGSGSAQFDDTTIASNAASASDITSGKLAFVNGELVTGTASGGGATLITKSITANGTYNASSDNADGYSSVTVNVSGGGGGLEYEAGTWIPASDVADYTISFSSTHTTAPFFYMVVDSGTDYFTTTNTNYATAVFSPYLFCGAIQKPSSGANYYAYMHFRFRTSSSTAFSTGNSAIVSSADFGNWATSTGIRAYANSASRYWRSGRTYKWVAVWAPTS